MSEGAYEKFVIWLREKQAEEAKKIKQKGDKRKAPGLDAICEEDEEELA